MRTEKEVGGFKKFGKEANEAYRTYASLYLDYVDDNMNHFMWRDIDIWPWNNLEWSVGHKVTDEALIAKAYLDEAVVIAKTLSVPKQDLIRDYPLLKGLI